MVETKVKAEDVLAVRSRVSWSAIFAGAVMALAVYFLLSILGIAVGLSAVNRVGENELATGAAVWAIATLLVALFFGGWITSKSTVGENKTEAVIYGVLLWGVLFAFLLVGMAGGVRIGFAALLGEERGASPAVTRPVISEADLRSAGVGADQVQHIQDNLQHLSRTMRTSGNDNRVVQGAWWSFGGLLLSLFASIGGAVVGAGPALTLRSIRTASPGTVVHGT